MMSSEMMKVDYLKSKGKHFGDDKSFGKNMKEEVVDLSSMSLDTLPITSNINLGIIYKLDISNNNLQVIPESITARLVNVVVLDVHSNQLEVLPNSIGCMSKLNILNISSNQLKSLPNTIENCRKLEELKANFNQLTKLPDTIGFELINLKKLSVNSNKLVYLPSSTSQLTALSHLDVRLNRLRSLPDGLENLANLQFLNVSQNLRYLETLPYSLGLLASLVELDLSYNNISVLPASLGGLKRLRKVVVEGCPVVSPPPRVVERGLEAMKEYMRGEMNGCREKNKKRGWMGKMKKYGAGLMQVDREGYLMSEYRTIDGLASPKYIGMFSPRRLFSPKTYFTK